MLNVIFYEDINETDVPLKKSECHLETLKNGTNLFNNNYGDNIITFTSNLSSLTNGCRMFRYCTNLNTFTSDLSSLTYGYEMFSDCNSLLSFTPNLGSLTNGCRMFNNCQNLKPFKSDFDSLIVGEYMFYYNKNNLTSFENNLESLSNGYGMFCFCDNLALFKSNLNSLIVGDYMFYETKLDNFAIDLSSLINGNSMFDGCDSLTNFTSDLKSLINGVNMFNKTKLSPKSVMYIVESIRDITYEKSLLSSDDYITYDSESQKYSGNEGWMSDESYVYSYMWGGDYETILTVPQLFTNKISASDVGKLTIGIDVINDSSTIEQQLQTFAKDAYYDSWEDLNKAFTDKGWTVTWQYGGTNTSII